MLPTQTPPRKQDLGDLTLLAYGRSKIGKSSWCAHSEGALFLATEPGLNALDVCQVPIQCWDQLLAACGELAEGEHPFKTIIVDTVENAYRMCADHICAKFKIEHESDLGYGKGWALINNEFHRVLTKMAFMPYGLFLVSHSVEREIETRTGKYTRIVPTLPDKARKIVLGMVDLILYCDLEAVTDAATPPTAASCAPSPARTTRPGIERAACPRPSTSPSPSSPRRSTGRRLARPPRQPSQRIQGDRNHRPSTSRNGG